jgi:hypothetical protein
MEAEKLFAPSEEAAGKWNDVRDHTFYRTLTCLDLQSVYKPSEKFMKT